MSPASVVVLAAGAGSRFGGGKQFELLGDDVRLVDAAVDAALTFTGSVVVVLPDGVEWDGRPVESIVSGGVTRGESVRAGLAALPADCEVVLLHDAAHPLAPAELFAELVSAVDAGADAAVPVLPVGDVVKRLHAGGLTTVGRDDLGLAQMPMAFRREALAAAHESPAPPDWPDWEDSMLVEARGGLVVAVPGSPSNVHVVTPGDLDVARAIASMNRVKPKFEPSHRG